MKIITYFILCICVYGCSQKKDLELQIIKPDAHWLDSIKKASDTSWVKDYRNNEFVKAEYYLSKKDSVLTQVMKDSFDHVRQVIAVRDKQTRLFFAQYYANGQLMAKFQFDTMGRYTGMSTSYYQTGVIKSNGEYKNGFHWGKWKNYDEQGNYISTDEYDENGQLVTKAEE